MSTYRRTGAEFYSYDFKVKGYRFSGSTGTADECAAADVEKTKRSEAKAFVADLIATARSPLTIQRARERWWSEHGQHLNDPDLEARLRWLWTNIGSHTLISGITNDMVSRLVQLRRSDRRKAGRVVEGGITKQLWRPITARTVNKTTVSLLRRVLRRAKDNWNASLPNEPAWSKHWLKQIKRPIREISPAEEQRLDREETLDYKLIRAFAIITGLRRRNLLLTWPQVDFEAGVIRIITKGGVPRILPLTRQAYAILWSRRGHHPVFVFTFEAQRTRLCAKTKDPVTGERRKFIKGVRYPVTYYGLGSAKRYAWARAGVDARIHDLRHTTGMRTLRATGNLRFVQGILGHSDIAITARFYTDALVDDMRAAMETTAAASAPLALPAPDKAASGDDTD